MKLAQSPRVRPAAAAEVMSTVRNPNRCRIGVVNGLIAMLPTNTPMTSMPERRGLQPKPSWNISARRKGAALIATRKKEPPRFAARNVGTRSTRRSSKGWVVLRRWTTAHQINTVPTPIPAPTAAHETLPSVTSSSP